MQSGSINDVTAAQLRKFPWRVFWFLLAASLAGGAAGIPLALEVFRPLVQGAPLPPIPFPLLIAIGFAQNALFLAVLIGVGLLLARRLDMGAPLLESWLHHQPPSASVRDTLKSGVPVGIGVGIVVLVALLIAAPHLPGLPFVTAGRAPIWKRILVCFYGGIDEEVISRLFLLTLLGWLGARVFQKQKARMSTVTFWCANIIVAILFGLGHLPNAAMVMRITPTVVVLALSLNGIAAISFGYLYWKRGLESAMLAHFCADFVIYVVGPVFLKH
jgi:membrane protease YdiL (CAAX protease family)